MSVARVAEISGSSPMGFKEAVEAGIEHANKSLENVKGVWIKEQKAVVVDGSISEYRVDMKVTYIAAE